MELHGCCARVSLSEALLNQHIDGVARASSASTKSRSAAASHGWAYLGAAARATSDVSARTGTMGA